MRHPVNCLAALGLVASLAACKKAEAPAPPPVAPVAKGPSLEGAPAAGASTDGTPAEGAAVGASPAGAAAAPAAPEAEPEPANLVAAERAARARELEAQRKALPPAATPEGGTSDCESGIQFDRLSLAQQQLALARREAEQARAKVEEKEGEVEAILIDALKRQAEECKAGALDLGCVGASTGDPKRCASAKGVGSSEECLTLATLRRAVLAKDGGACAGVPAGTLRALCVGGATGKYDCDDADASNVGRTCRLLAAGGEPSCEEGSADAEVCASFWILHGMAKQDAAVCARVPSEAIRQHCVGIATGDPTKCAGGGRLPASCRQVMMSSDVVEVEGPEGPRYELHMKALNLYGDLGRCKAVLSVRHGGQDIAMEKDMGELPPGSGVRSLTWPLEGIRSKPVVLAGTECSWEPVAPAAPAP